MSLTKNQLSFNNSGYYFIGLHVFVLPGFRALHDPLLPGIAAGPLQIVNQNKW